ncbi:MAG: extracellular solute-binding protein [Ruminococcaceae bacterium]|nr:extracellular solute-binding protein [Oscillospiraceae bacterium]
MKKVLYKALAIGLALCMLLPLGVCSVFAADGDASGNSSSSNMTVEEIKELLGSLTYQEYQKLYADKAVGKGKLVIDAKNFDVSTTTAEVIKLENYEGASSALLIPDDGRVTWNFDITSEGLYNVEIKYYTLEGYDVDGDGKLTEGVDVISRGNSIERAILIDGSYPFKESRYCEFQRVWTDVYVQCEYVQDKKEGYIYQYKEKSAKDWINFEYDGYVAIPLLEEGQKATDLYDFRAVNKNDTTQVLEVTVANTAKRNGFELDKFGNEIRPEKVQAPTWCVGLAADSTGYAEDPFAYFLTKGAHSITLESVQEPIVIESVTIYAEERLAGTLPSYEEYKALHSGKPTPSADKIRIDAEMPKHTSAEILYPTYDRTSAITEPQDSALIFLNTVGGDKWQTVGQWIEWDFVVEESGLYEIVPRFSQDGLAGMYVSRSLTIDGKVPFEEANRIQFNYSDNWQVKPFGSGEEAYKFYFEKGTHTIRLNVVLGQMAEVIQEVEECLNIINSYYMKVLMLTGPDPDDYRDYEFASRMPDVLEGFLEASKRLKAVSAELEAVIGEKGDHSVTLDNIAQLCEMMGEDEDNIAPSFDTLKSYIGNLGTWIMDSRNQPLELDYIDIVPAGGEYGQAEANFFEAMGYELGQFIMSFFSDYSGYGARSINADAETKTIEVWTSTGRDQASIIRSMISDDFTPNSNIMVDLKLITGATLLPATLSGTGPDVAMSIGTESIVNYAIRGAIRPLNVDNEEKGWKKFDGFDEHIKSFSNAAMIPLTLYGEAYALPETQSFSVLFYRMDILASLGVEIPRTWDDVYAMLPELQTNYLQFGMGNSLGGLQIFLYQRTDANGNQVQLYKDPINNDPKTFGMEINLDSDVALDCFKQMSEFFTMYDFPKTYDFANRFRSGEMPLAIADYTAYSQLTIFAPEIRGLWGFTLIPGTLSADGKVNHTTNSAVAGIMMLDDCEEPEASWEYMKWWTGADAQSKYGIEYKALLGASGQYATANLEALERMPWTSSERQTLAQCFDWLTATPELPGGYIIGRNVEFAFLKVYNDSADPVESLLDYIDAINSELSRKRKEFDLPVREDFIEK